MLNIILLLLQLHSQNPEKYSTLLTLEGELTYTFDRMDDDLPSFSKSLPLNIEISVTENTIDMCVELGEIDKNINYFIYNNRITRTNDFSNGAGIAAFIKFRWTDLLAKSIFLDKEISQWNPKTKLESLKYTNNCSHSRIRYEVEINDKVNLNFWKIKVKGNKQKDDRLIQSLDLNIDFNSSAPAGSNRIKRKTHITLQRK